VATAEQATHVDAPAETSRSKVKLTLNSKGDVQIDVSVVAGDEPAEVELARTQAVKIFNELRQAYPR
jgi:hypothetical protein